MSFEQTFQKESIMWITSWVLLWLEKSIKVPEAAKTKDNGQHQKQLHLNTQEDEVK